MKTTETITVTITTTEDITMGGDVIKHAEIQAQHADIFSGTTRLIPLDTDRFIDWLDGFKIIK